MDVLDFAARGRENRPAIQQTILGMVGKTQTVGSQSMIYELRIYETFAGKLPDLHRRFNDHTTRLFEKHGMKNVGYWTSDVGPRSNTLTYMLAFKDAGQRMDAWKSFRADPEWQRVFTESHKDGIIVANVENRILVPTPYSPLQ